MKAFPCLLPVLGILCCRIPAAEKPDRTWADAQGRSFPGTYLRGDGVNVWIKRHGQAGGEVAVPVAVLAAADQAAVKSLQSDFSWKLASVRWPGSIAAPATMPAYRTQSASKEFPHLFKTVSKPGSATGGFEFESDSALEPQVVGDFGRTFEAARDLFAQFPWDVRPAPPDGANYKVRLFGKRDDFMKATGVADQGSAKILGLYMRNDRIVYVPLESLVGGKHASNETLRHELAHQMMHDLLPLMPWWVAEGTAEYIRCIPWDARGVFHVSATGSTAVMKRIATEGEFDHIAFDSMMNDAIVAPREAQMGEQMASVQGGIKADLLQIQKARAAQLAGKAPARKAPGQQSKVATMKAEGFVIPQSPYSDAGALTVLKYHAAKLFVYYLQHLDGDGKGAKMLQLMWHLRQWADEINVQRARFAKEEDEFRKKLEVFQARAKDYDKLQEQWIEAYPVWLRAYTGKPTDPPKPVPPEDELLKLLPEPPDYAVFTPMRLQSRWLDIRKKTLGDPGVNYFQLIVDAFKARKIDLPIR